MSDTVFKLRQIISLILFIGALSLLGMITQKPLMIIPYGVFFIAVVAVMFLFMQKRQRHFETVKESSPVWKRILGVAFLLLALATPPVLSLRSSVISLPETMGFTQVLVTSLGAALVYVVLILPAVYLINFKGNDLAKRVIGFVLFFIGTLFPGILMSFIDKSTTGIGSIYYVALAVLVFAYTGFGLVLNRE